MPLSPAELLNQLDFETELAKRIRAANKTLPLEVNSPLWLAEQTSLIRIDAITVMLGGTIPDPDAPQIRIAFAGSSTYQRYETDGGGTPVNGALKTGDGLNFNALGTTGYGLLTYAGIIARRTGRNARYLMVAQGGTTTVGDWLPAGSTQRASLVNGIKAMGGCELVNWACDFNDLLQNLAADRDGTLANIRRFYQLVRDETGIPNLKFTQGVIQAYRGTAASMPDARWTAVRAAEMIAATDANVIFGTHWYDLPQVSDGIHMTDLAYGIHATRLAENSLAILGLGNATPERGPRVVSAEAVYSTQTRITLAHDTGNDITPPSGITGISVSFDGGQTLKVAIGRRIDATTVMLTHAESGGAAPWVYAYAGRSPDTTTVLRDNSPRTLPLNPVIDPIIAPAGSTVVAPPPANTRVVMVAFSKSLVPPAPYNAFHDAGSQAQNANAGLSIQLLDTNGQATGWTLTAVNAFASGNDLQGTSTNNNSGRYPDAVMLGYIYNGVAANGDNAGVETPSTDFVLRGPADAQNFEIELDLFGSRSAPDRRVTFTAGGLPKTIDAGQNTSAIATFTGLRPDVNGEVPFSFSRAANYQYGYLNVAVIRIIG